MSGFSVTQLLETKLCRASTRNAAVPTALQRLSPVGRFRPSIVLREVQFQSTRKTNSRVKPVCEGREHARTIIQSRIPDVGTCNCINSRIFPSLPLHALIRPVTVKIAGRRSCLNSEVDNSQSTAAQKLKSELQLQNTSIQHETITLRIFISTGDVSGDLHATGLVKELQKLAKMAGQDISICALGGGTIEEAGVSLIGEWHPTPVLCSLTLPGANAVQCGWSLQCATESLQQGSLYRLGILRHTRESAFSSGLQRIALVCR
jgi:hypothetical protein